MIVVYHKALLIATLSILISHENFKSDHPVRLHIKEEACLKPYKSDAVVQREKWRTCPAKNRKDKNTKGDYIVHEKNHEYVRILQAIILKQGEKGKRGDRSA